MNIFKQKRKELNMTQAEFAIKTGMPLYAISRMENGHITIKQASAFCNTFHPEFEIREMQVKYRKVEG